MHTLSKLFLPRALVAALAAVLLIGALPAPGASAAQSYEMGDFIVATDRTPGDMAIHNDFYYDVEAAALVLRNGGSYSISMRNADKATGDAIKIEKTADLTIHSLNIDRALAGGKDGAPIHFVGENKRDPGSTVTVVGLNMLKAAGNHAALYADVNSPLTLSGDGRLVAQGSGHSPGIGSGDPDRPYGKIAIADGLAIAATGAQGAAGIGGGMKVGPSLHSAILLPEQGVYARRGAAAQGENIAPVGAGAQSAGNGAWEPYTASVTYKDAAGNAVTLYYHKDNIVLPDTAWLSAFAPFTSAENPMWTTAQGDAAGLAGDRLDGALLQGVDNIALVLAEGGAGAQARQGENAAYRVTASRLNIRSGAGAGYPVVASAARGSALSVARLSNGWAQIALADGSLGWVSARYISAM